MQEILSIDSGLKGDQQLQLQCCCYIDKNNNSSIRLTIKQFTKSYTTLSDNKFDGKQRLNQPYFSKTGQISSNLFKFDVKDADNTSFDAKTNPAITKESSTVVSEVVVADKKDSIKSNSDTFSLDMVNHDSIKNIEVLKYDQKAGHNNEQYDILDSNNSCLFECYYCKEFSSTYYRIDYERHVVLKHPNKLAYPSIPDLEKMNISPKRKEWEI